MAVPARHRYRFGPFELDPRSGELFKGLDRVRLQEQPLAALLALLERPGDVITHSELRVRVWPKDTFVLFEHGLHGVMGRLRESLGDDSAAPTFIETVPRRGYRFVAPVTLVEGSASTIAMVAPPMPSATSGSPVWSAAGRAMRLRTTVVAAVALATVVGVLSWRQLASQRAASATTIRLAVLPFENLTGDEEQQFFVDGLHEELSARLGRLQPRQLAVIARSSVLSYRALRKTIADIARELQVDYVLEGSVRRADNHVRITAQLIKSSDQSQVLVETYDRTWTDVLAVQKDIAARVADALTLEFVTADPSQAARDAAIVPAAYEHYLRGRFLWDHRSRDPRRQLAQAIAEFERAIAAQPDFSDAYVGLADAWNSLAFSGTLPGNDAYERARAAVERALQLNDRSPAAQATHAWMLVNVEHDWAGAQQAFERAIALDPNDTLTRFRHAHLLALLGRLEDAERATMALRPLDPRSHLIPDFLAYLAWYAGDEAQALRYMKEASDLEPSTARYRGFAAYVAATKGQCEQVHEEFAQLTAASDGLPTSSMVAYAVGRCGTDNPHLTQFLDTLDARPLPFARAQYHLGRGETTQFFAWFSRAVDAGHPEPIFMNVEPTFRAVRSDPRFRSLQERLHLDRPDSRSPPVPPSLPGE